MSSPRPAALPQPNPRAEASRRNGAKSRGPKTSEGKARSAQNAWKHGLCAQTLVALGDEDRAAFEALEAALVEELAPEGTLQWLLAGRIARAMWRLERAERIEGELFDHHAGFDGNLGLALIRDGRGGRAFETLLRYRGGASAELWRALRLLKALQAEGPAALEAPAARTPRTPKPERTPEPLGQPAAQSEAPVLERVAGCEPPASGRTPAPPALAARQRNEPKARRNPEVLAASTDANEPAGGPEARDHARPLSRRTWAWISAIRASRSLSKRLIRSWSALVPRPFPAPQTVISISTGTRLTASGVAA